VQRYTKIIDKNENGQQVLRTTIYPGVIKDKNKYQSSNKFTGK
jgi:hypothetical protein